MELRSFFTKGVLSTVALASLACSGLALGAAKDVDFNADNTAESTVNLTVVTTSPVKIQDKVTNKAVGQSFRFAWPSAGPGGFSSSLAPGSASGVGAIWTWQTTRQVFSYTGTSCTNDICANRTIPADNLARGPFGVPGRSLSSTGVTTTSESLTSTLVTFFSPPQELFRLTSSVEQLAPGVFRYKQVIENKTGAPITVNQSSGPYGCDTSCGNGVREGSELCDGSDLGEASCLMFNDVGTLLCGADCHSYDTSNCTPIVCGNGVREPNEQCDGSDLGGEPTCDGFGGTGGPVGCNPDCTYDLHNCSNVCHNGVREGDEACDGSDLGGQTCESLGGGSTSGFTFNGFDDSNVCSGGDCTIQSNGSASPTTDDQSRPVLRLTPSLGSQAGSAYFKTPIPVGRGFTTDFTFRMSQASSPPADGIAFVVQSSGLSALGGGGGIIGYNFPNSLAVEFDTYTNSDFGDPNDNHIAVQSCGTAQNSPLHPPVPGNCTLGSVDSALPVTLADGAVHSARIRWIPDVGSALGYSGEVRVYLDGSSTPAVTAPYDLALIGLGGSDNQHAYVGFTAATGAAFENHDILSWSLSLDEPDPGGSLTCGDFCQFNTTQCTNVCGNGVLEAGEECDGYDLGGASCADQGGVGFAYCTNDCHLGYYCTTEYCGNGVADGKEACDGSDLRDNDCQSVGASGGTLGCDDKCGFDLSGCSNICGNGVIDGEGEDCDGTDFGGLTCANFGGTSTEGHLSCYGCAIDTSSCNLPPADCDTNATSNVVPAAGSDPGKVETCEISAHPAKEISTKIDVCGSAIPDGPDSCGSDPATSGTANIFVPDLDTVIGPVFFTATGIRVVAPDADGLPKPGQTVNVFVPLINAGIGTAVNVHATLSSPAYDIDGDGIDDPVVIDQAFADYPGAPCFVGLQGGIGDCNTLAAPPVACENLTPFVVTFPAGHPADVGRRFTLTISYNQAGEPGLGSTTGVFTRPIVLGVGSVPLGGVCGDGVVDPGEDCDDGNTDDDRNCCTADCHFQPENSGCGATDGCTILRCNATGSCIGTAVVCDDHNPCTLDRCQNGTCRFEFHPGGACDDGNPCTIDDTCDLAVHACRGTGITCNDGNICTDDACNGSGCTYTSNNTCGANPKGQGYWKRICMGPHPSGEFISDVDVQCVNDTCTFGSVSSPADICDRMNPNPQNDKCEKAEAHFMSLLLNVCRGRVGRFEDTQSGCGHNNNVDEAIRDADALLCSPSRTSTTCNNAQCETEEINNGKALGVTSLRVKAPHNGPVVLTWGPPYTDSESASAIKYRVWRRPNSDSTFTQLTQTTALTYTDTTANGTTYQYEVTVVW